MNKANLNIRVGSKNYWKTTFLSGKELNERNLSDLPRVENATYEVKYSGVLSKSNIKSIIPTYQV
jgi:hypothetical protein